MQENNFDNVGYSVRISHKKGQSMTEKDIEKLKEWVFGKMINVEYSDQ